MIVLKILLSQDSAGALHAEFIDGLNSVSQNNASKNIVKVVLDGFELQTEEMLQIAYATSLNENDPNTENVGFNFMEKSFESNSWLAEIDPLVLDRRGSWHLGLRVVTETDGVIQTVSNETEMLEFTVNATIQDKNGNYPTKADVSALYQTAVNAVAQSKNVATETATQVASKVSENVANEKLTPIIQVTEEQLGANFELLVNENTYELTARLTAKNGAILSEKIVDLPLEEMIVDAYQNEGGNLVIVLKNGQERTIELGALIKGLVSQKDFDDLVNSKGQPNGVATLNNEGKVPSAQLPALDYLPITGGVVNGSVTANEFLINDADEVTTYQAHSIQEGLNTYQFRGKSGTFALLSDLEPIETTANLAMQILYQASIVYNPTTEDTYDERITAEGLNVVDGSVAVLQKVVGSTVRCDNFVDISTIQSNGINIENTGKTIRIIGVYSQSVNTLRRLCPYLVAGKTYTFSAYKTTNISTYDRGGAVTIRNNAAGTSKSIIPNGLGLTKAAVEITEEDLSLPLYFYGNNNGTATDYIEFAQIMCVEGDYTSTELPPYQPYFTGLKSASFAGIESGGRNLIPYPYSGIAKNGTVTMNGITFTDNGDGSITVNGTAEKTSALMLLAQEIPINQDFFLSGCPMGGGLSSYSIIAYYDNSVNWAGGDHGGGANIFKSNADANNSSKLKQISIIIWGNATVKNLTIYPMLNPGSTAEPYTPYIEPTVLNFPKTPTPMGTTIDFENKKIIEEYAEITQDTPFTEEQLAEYSDYIISQDGKNIRYKLATPTERDFTEEQKVAGKKYLVQAFGTEKVIDNDGAEFGANNTLTQDYIAIKE